MLDCVHRDSDSDLSLKTTTSTGSSSMSSSSDTCCSTTTRRLSSSTSSPDPTTSLKPHRSSTDCAYSAILRRTPDISSRDFRLLRRLGSGDIGTVYLCRLNSQIARKNDSTTAAFSVHCEEEEGEPDEEIRSCFYAMKVVDKEALAVKKKVQRAEMERKILKMLDHPFLPTLYAEFEASHFSCIVMEYCSGGDLHTLRHKQPHKRFSLHSARFYAAEVLVALEYLHMLGIIYRDLKPENVLVRSDGHIMLSDFDLSLCSDAIPAVESPSCSPHAASPLNSPYSKPHRTKTQTKISCFNWLFRSRKIQTLTPNRLFVAEPVDARSCSFVGTHEYVAPEVASGGSHGNAVDWWALGVFIYEMIYGRTPFAAQSNDLTLRNIVKKPLTFPTQTPCSSLEVHARDLISGLLSKDPESRFGSKRGAADVKAHPFFKGLNFALIRTVTPPEIPGLRRQRTTSHNQQRQSTSSAFDYF